jgi:serine/threonine protein kinase
MKDRIGHYRVSSVLSSGGMATIYLGQHAELGRQVVIKQLHPHLSNDQGFVKRFEREAKLLGRLHHENVVDVIDYFESEGAYYIILEYIEGCSLKDLLDRHRKVPFLIAVHIVSQIARGLQHAHQNGIIHRDIKPANIMLTSSGGVKITDFGLAYAKESLTITDPGTFVGTPAYLAPEQVRGQTADAQSDIYALGVIFYELISGSNPFAGQTHSETIDRTLRCVPKDLSRQYDGLPLGVDSIAQKLLDKNPRHRYVDVAKVLHDLNPYNLAGAEMFSRYMADPGNYHPRQEDINVIKKIARSERLARSLKQMVMLMVIALLILLGGQWGYKTVSDFLLKWRQARTGAPRDTLRSGLPDTVLSPTPVQVLSVVGTEGASLFLNGKPAGTTPANITAIAPGSYKLVARKDGYEDWARDFSIKAGQVLVMTAEMKPRTLPPGYLKLAAKPWAEVYIDGRYYDRTPLDQLVRLAVGSHELILRHPNRKTHRQTIDITSKDTVLVDVAMPEAYGELRISVTPWAVVYIDGEEMGTTPLGAPLKISIGEHELLLKGPSGKEWNETLIIEEDKVLERNVVLQ